MGISRLDVRLGFTETLHAIASFPLATFLKDLDAFETLENIAFNDETAACFFETVVL